MENAGRGEFPEGAEREGLGTPATRAATIEKLVFGTYLERRKSAKVTYLHPTALGKSQIAILPDQLRVPWLTVYWEQQLKAVETGQLSEEDFLYDICTMIRGMLQSYTPPPEAKAMFQTVPEEVGKCPRCGSGVVERSKGFCCGNQDCKFALWKNNRFFAAKQKELTREVAATLLRDGKVRLTGCHSQKTGKSYDATVVLLDKGDRVDYELEFSHRA